MVDRFIKVAKLGSPHGLKGYVKIIPIIDPPELLHELQSIFFENDSNNYMQLDIEVMKPYKKNSWLFKAKQWQSIDDIENFVNMYLVCNKEELPKLAKNQYYIGDIIGCTVVDLDNKYLGKILDVLQYSSSDIYKIGEGSKSFLLPAVKEFIKDINIDKKLVQVKLPEGIEEI
ncbi:MAG: ribosome maturation factor RimM [Clostridia bacterium]